MSVPVVRTRAVICSPVSGPSGPTPSVKLRTEVSCEIVTIRAGPLWATFDGRTHVSTVISPLALTASLTFVAGWNEEICTASSRVRVPSVQVTEFGLPMWRSSGCPTAEMSETTSPSWSRKS